MRYISLLILSVASGVGCSVQRPDIEYVEVKVPVISCPKPPLIIAPKLLINELTVKDATDYNKIVNYYDATLQQLIAHIEKQQKIIKTYE